MLADFFAQASNTPCRTKPHWRSAHVALTTGRKLRDREITCAFGRWLCHSTRYLQRHAAHGAEAQQDLGTEAPQNSSSQHCGIAIGGSVSTQGKALGSSRGSSASPSALLNSMVTRWSSREPLGPANGSTAEITSRRLRIVANMPTLGRTSYVDGRVLHLSSVAALGRPVWLPPSDPCRRVSQRVRRHRSSRNNPAIADATFADTCWGHFGHPATVCDTRNCHRICHRPILGLSATPIVVNRVGVPSSHPATRVSQEFVGNGFLQATKKPKKTWA